MTAGYIWPVAKLETDKPNLSHSCPTVFLLDISFDINPDPSSILLHDCPFATVGGNITCTKPPPPHSEKIMSTFENLPLEYVIETLTTAAKGQSWHGLIGNVDDHGRWGALLDMFLFGHDGSDFRAIG